jgi:hypothetical protein
MKRMGGKQANGRRDAEKQTDLLFDGLTRRSQAGDGIREELFQHRFELAIVC